MLSLKIKFVKKRRWIGPDILSIYPKEKEKYKVEKKSRNLST